ncbi:MAG: sulfur carrier protein [Pirellulaceae bacterium]
MSDLNIAFNGDDKAVAMGTTVAELLKQLELNAKHVAVEVNFEVVPREQHEEFVLSDGDKMEVVSFVGGG